MTARDPEPNVLVEGMVLCYSTWAHVLFDSGASVHLCLLLLLPFWT